MTMLEGYAHIVDFFTALPWWRLQPDNEFFTAQGKTTVEPKLTYVAYTRDREGNTTLYVDGTSVAAGKVGGDTSSWDPAFRLALGNELTQDRPWLGELHHVALYARALDSGEIRRYARAARREAAADPLARYEFHEAQGGVVRDTAPTGEPLHLHVKDRSAVQWLEGGGLRIVKPTLIASSEPATKLVEAVKRSQAFTIEVWLKPANATQAGPARIVTLSKDASARNCTLGQKAGAYEVRFRTTRTSPNGEPSLSTPGGDETAPAVVGLRSERGDLAVLYFVAGGRAHVKAGSLSGHPQTRWFNPRTGQWSAAQPDDKGDFAAPDEQDWALLFGNQ